MLANFNIIIGAFLRKNYGVYMHHGLNTKYYINKTIAEYKKTI